MAGSLIVMPDNILGCRASAKNEPRKEEIDEGTDESQGGVARLRQRVQERKGLRGLLRQLLTKESVTREIEIKRVSPPKATLFPRVGNAADTGTRKAHHHREVLASR